MKKMILVAVSLVTLTVSAQEVVKPVTTKQPHEKREKLTAEQRAQKSVDALNAVAGLTDAQKPKVYDLALSRAKSVDEIRTKYKGDATQKETAKKEIMAVRKTYRENAKALLTPEQIEKIKAKHKENKATNKNAPDALEAND